MNLFYMNLFSSSKCFRRHISSFRIGVSSKTYLPNTFEDDYYNLWNEKGCFQPKEGRHTYSMVLPPPNVTGTLHLGHALTIASQDVWARWRRMCGSEVVWVPGMDHAGIATQAVVEKSLEKYGVTRLSIGREKFAEEVRKWKNEKGSRIKDQLKCLGASVDWSREFFTMDECQSKAVVEALLLLWNKGLIYRDEVLVNWSPHLCSTISDIEVNKVEIDGTTMLSLPNYNKPIEFGKLYEFAYKVVGSDEEIIVSTTRIETMVGDVAVAVNPKDEKYRHLWGSVLLHPFTGSEIPLILDYNVDPNFGTGALKITPAHDKTDFLIGRSHNLPCIPIINEEGMLINSGKFSGMKRYDARELIIQSLAEKGLLKNIKSHKMTIPLCSRSGDVIELLIKPQWFLKCTGMAEKAISAVKKNKLIIKPERYSANWFNWLENIQDWCISRQLWWGHQVPFYSCEGGGKQAWFPARSDGEAYEIGKTAFQGPVTITRGTDVLDTWFSSALLPFSCFGWPQKTDCFQKYYPLNTLVTGNDILFFWVARMVMLGLELTDELPFKEIFLHGIVCDSIGRKMSKSLGNIIEPEDVIKGIKIEDLKKRIDNSFLSDVEKMRAKDESQRLYSEGIPECGVDALRFSLLSSNIKNQNVTFEVKDCEGVKRFCNKLWQVTKFANTWLNKFSISTLFDNYQPKPLHVMDKWILAKFMTLVHTVNTSLTNGDFYVAATALRNFVHHDLCDIYVESIKPDLRKGENEDVAERLKILLYILNSSLKCLSPFMPFLTELLYHKLPGNQEDKPLMEMSYPSIDHKLVVDEDKLERVSHGLNIVNSIRRLKHEAGIGDQHNQIWLESSTDLSDLREVIETLGRCKLEFGKLETESNSYKVIPVNEETLVSLILQDNEPSDVDLPSLMKKYDKMKEDLNKLLKTISNDGYKRAPPHIQKSHKEKIMKLKLEIHKIDSLLEKRALKM